MLNIPLESIPEEGGAQPVAEIGEQEEPTNITEEIHQMKNRMKDQLYSMVADRGLLFEDAKESMMLVQIRFIVLGLTTCGTV